MINKERLEILEGQVENNGHHRHTLERMAREGVPVGEHGPMIAVSVNELRVLLRSYRVVTDMNAGHEAPR